ncbi:hypothetical protein SRHO_G00026240 [Serrasalmus rhombeus]
MVQRQCLPCALSGTSPVKAVVGENAPAPGPTAQIGTSTRVADFDPQSRQYVTEASLSKAPNPQLLPGCLRIGLPTAPAAESQPVSQCTQVRKTFEDSKCQQTLII